MVVDGAAEDRGEPLVGTADAQVRVDQQETERRLAENGLRRGKIGLDPAQNAYVHDYAHGGPLALLGPRRHDVDLGESFGGQAGAFGVGQPEGDHTGPLAAVEDFGHLPLAQLSLVLGDEGLDGVHADRTLGRDAEELLGAQTPLVDEAVGADGERGDLYVVVDRSGRTALPHDLTGHLARRFDGHAGYSAAPRAPGLVRHRQSAIACRRISHRAARRVLGLRGLRWYLAHANRPLQLTASGTGHRRRLPAVSSTTVPHNTVFTITARSRCF
jgi:hypothetical protein